MLHHSRNQHHQPIMLCRDRMRVNRILVSVFNRGLRYYMVVYKNISRFWVLSSTLYLVSTTPKAQFQTENLSTPDHKIKFENQIHNIPQFNPQVAITKLRPKSYPQHTVEPIFAQPATRNFGCVSVFSSPYVQPYRWALFFYFYYII